MFLVILFWVAILAAELRFSDVVQSEKYQKYKKSQEEKRKNPKKEKVKINREVVSWLLLLIGIAIAAALI